MSDRRKKQKRVDLKHLGRPALLQLQAMGIDVSKHLDRNPSIPLGLPTGAGPTHNKFNVSAAEERTVDGIKFSSKLEMNVYIMLRDRNVVFDRQPQFVLQEGFVHEGKKIRDIRYVGDFLIHAPGQDFVVDTKGMETSEFKLKQKMMLAKGIVIHRIKSLGAMLTFLVENNCLPPTT